MKKWILKSLDCICELTIKSSQSFVEPIRTAFLEHFRLFWSLSVSRESGVDQDQIIRQSIGKFLTGNFLV
jgi:hypothetical protein